MIFRYNGFPDIWVRAADADDAMRLVQAEVAQYGDDIVESDEIELVPSEGVAEVIHVNSA